MRQFVEDEFNHDAEYQQNEDALRDKLTAIREGKENSLNQDAFPTLPPFVISTTVDVDKKKKSENFKPFEVITNGTETSFSE